MFMLGLDFMATCILLCSILQGGTFKMGREGGGGKFIEKDSFVTEYITRHLSL